MSTTPKVFRRERARYIRDSPPPSVLRLRAEGPSKWPVWLGTRRCPLEGWAARRFTGDRLPSSFARLSRLSRLRKAYGRRWRR